MAFRLRREQRKKLRSAASGGDECRQGEELEKRPLPKRRSACKSSPCEKSPAAGPNDLLPPRQTGRCAKHHGRRRQPAQPAVTPAAAAAGISAAPAASETAGCTDLIPGGFDPRAGLRPRIADPFAEERYGRPKRHPADDDAAPLRPPPSPHRHEGVLRTPRSPRLRPSPHPRDACTRLRRKRHRTKAGAGRSRRNVRACGRCRRRRPRAPHDPRLRAPPRPPRPSPRPRLHGAASGCRCRRRRRP